MTTKKVPGEATNVRRTSEATTRVVFAGVIANAATQFAIQAWMSYRFAKDVWDIPRPLCVAIIVALDLFAVMFMVFTYLLREAKWFTQAYVWLVFAAGVGAQLFAAELYGAKEEWAGPVRTFAALPALFLAASLHGLIIWRNHAGRKIEPVRAEPLAFGLIPFDLDPAPRVYRVWDIEDVCIYIGSTEDLLERFRQHHSADEDWLIEAVRVTHESHETIEAARLAETAAIRAERPRFNRYHNPDLPKLRAEGAAPVKSYSKREKEIRQSRPAVTVVTKLGRGGHPQKAEAIRRVHAGENTADVAADLGVTRRAVQSWMKNASAPAPADPVPAQINGHAFTPGAATEAQVN